MDENTRLQKAFVYVVLALVAALFVAAAYVAIRCYTPYSFRNPMNTELKGTLWSFMLLPSVVLPVALWLSNMLNPALSRYSIIAVLMSCCFFAAIPGLYKLYDGADMAVTTSVLALFLMSCSITAVIKDLRIRPTVRWINISLCIIFILAFTILTGYSGYFIINFDFMDRIVVCVLTPMLCLIYLLSSVIEVYTPTTVILSTVTTGYAALCSAFEAMNKRPLFFVLLGLFCLAVIWQITDLIKYIRSKNNDSKSCNA